MSPKYAQLDEAIVENTLFKIFVIYKFSYKYGWMDGCLQGTYEYKFKIYVDTNPSCMFFELEFQINLPQELGLGSNRWVQVGEVSALS